MVGEVGMKGFMFFLPQATRKSVAEAEPICAPPFFPSLFTATLLYRHHSAGTWGWHQALSSDFRPLLMLLSGSVP